jgi:outer membrane protein assembly factor BamB
MKSYKIHRALISSRRASRTFAALLAVTLTAALGAGTAVAATSSRPATRASVVTAADWPAYLNGPLHRSYNPTEEAITPKDVSSLVRKWHVAQGQNFLASPTAVDGAVFIGSDTGWFYKLNIKSGAVEHKVFLGYRPQNLCGAYGIVATATVATNPRNHKLTVYIGSANGYLYAFNAANLSLDWKSAIAIPSPTVTNYYEWSSPTVANGKIYIGVSSNCDSPLIRGGVIAYRQATGKKIAEYYTVPRGVVGGSVWSSVAIAPNGDVYASTGNGPISNERLDSSESVVRLAPNTLKLLARFKVPASQTVVDGDFGGSPIIFGRYVGACNKNGIFYALNLRSLRVAWEQRIGASGSSAVTAECDAAPAYNGNDLYFAATAVTIKGKTYRGSVQERVATTGKLIWIRGLPNGVTGSPTLDGSRVIAVGTYDNGPVSNETYLVSASTGKILRTLVSGLDFAQSVFADNWLFTANSNGVYAWGLGGRRTARH